MHAVASLVVACRPQDGVTKLEMSVRRQPRFRQQVRRISPLQGHLTVLTVTVCHTAGHYAVKSTMTETCSVVLRSRRNCSSDGAEQTDDGRAFHARAVDRQFTGNLALELGRTLIFDRDLGRP